MSTEEQELESLRDIVVEMEQKLLLCRETLHAIKGLDINNANNLIEALEMANDCLLRLDDFYRVRKSSEAGV